jgi:hypothetical protein
VNALLKLVAGLLDKKVQKARLLKLLYWVPVVSRIVENHLLYKKSGENLTYNFSKGNTIFVWMFQHFQHSFIFEKFPQYSFVNIY